MTIEEIQQEVMELFDSRVGELSQEDYRGLVTALKVAGQVLAQIAVREEIERDNES